MGSGEITTRALRPGRRPGGPYAPVESDRGTPPPAACAPATSDARLDQRRAVILEADDLGLLHAFNEGIRSAYRHGRLTSTCLRANGYAYDHAVGEILPACPGIGVGVHLCLNEGHRIAPREHLSLLLGPDGSLRSGFVWLMKLARSRVGREQIQRELRAQMEKVLGAGIAVDHLNSHQHVHMIPGIFSITCRLARDYGIPCVRLVRELPYQAGGLRRRVQPLLNTNYIKHLLLNHFARINERTARRFGVWTTDYFIGVNYTAHMSLDTIRCGLQAAPCGSVEVLFHPAIWPDPRDVRCPDRSLHRYAAAPQRGAELHALGMPELSDFLRRERWTTTSFAAWARARQLSQPRETSPHVPDPVKRICDTVTVTGPPWVSAAQDDSRAFAQLVVTQVSPGQRALDVGTGTGIVAICLARAGRQVVATDISAAALRAAAANAARNRVHFQCCRSDLLAAVPGRFDLIDFNPPYNFRPDTFATNLAKNLLRRVHWVRRTSGLAMPRPVLKFHQQLVARLIRQAPDHLNPGGAVLLHAYESEVAALTSVLPPHFDVELLHHPGLSNRTVGMLIRLSPARSLRPTLQAPAASGTMCPHAS